MTTRRRREDDESQSKRRREANKAICQPQPPTIMPVFSHLQGACCKSTHWMVHPKHKTKQMAVMTSFYQYKVWNCSRAYLLISNKTFQTPSHVVTPWAETQLDHFLHAITSNPNRLTHTAKQYNQLYIKHIRHKATANQQEDDTKPQQQNLIYSHNRTKTTQTFTTHSIILSQKHITFFLRVRNRNNQ